MLLSGSDRWQIARIVAVAWSGAVLLVVGSLEWVTGSVL